MFGYVKPCQPQLRVCELQAYKAVYCGLCAEMGRAFGLLARFTLSYDATFLALLAMAVAPEEPEIHPGRCTFNPLYKAPVCRPSKELSFAGDVAALTLYHKLRDDREDKGFWGRLGARLALGIFRRVWHDAAVRQPELAAVMETQMDRQRELEARRAPGVDEACDPTAQILAAVFVKADPAQRRVLERLGYLVGRYVYLSDALDDLDQDRETGGYNPFLLREGASEAVKQTALGSIYLTIGEASATYQLLEVRRFGPILENILTLGMKGTADSLLLPPKERKQAKL